MDNKKKKRFSVKEYIMPKHIVQKLIGTTNHWNAYLAQDLLSLLLLLQKKIKKNSSFGSHCQNFCTYLIWTFSVHMKYLAVLYSSTKFYRIFPFYSIKKEKKILFLYDHNLQWLHKKISIQITVPLPYWWFNNLVLYLYSISKNYSCNINETAIINWLTLH